MKKEIPFPCLSLLNWKEAMFLYPITHLIIVSNRKITLTVREKGRVMIGYTHVLVECTVNYRYCPLLMPLEPVNMEGEKSTQIKMVKIGGCLLLIYILQKL